MRKKTRKKSKSKSKKSFPDCVGGVEPIVCDLLERSQYAGILPNYEPDEKRKGTYHGSVFNDVKGWGVDRWVVTAG